MTKIHITYQGQLHCEATHLSSGEKISTDAPTDNEGLGQAFSPTDLLATALGSCMATVMGIVARRKNLTLDGLHIDIEKQMSTDSPRRITALTLNIHIPLTENHEHAPLLIAAAKGCPVHHSLHPDILTTIHWHWQ